MSMQNLSKLSAALGLLLLLMTIILRVWGISPVDIGIANVRHLSLLVLANTFILIAILFRK